MALARRLCFLCFLPSLIFAAAPARAAQGVSAHEVVVGTHLDLSGPLAAWGTAVRNGLQMAFDEANAAGGVNGRKLRLVVEDDAYDPGKALDAVDRLITQDQVFAILSPLGTPTVQASIDEALDHDVLHLFPITVDEQTYLPLHPLKFAITAPYADQVAAGLGYLLGAHKTAKVGVLYQEDNFGRSVRAGAEAELARRGFALASSTTCNQGTTDFSAQIAKLRADRVDIVVLGTVMQNTLAVMRAAAAKGWHPVFLCSAACYAPETAALGGSIVEGLYAVGEIPIPYPDDPNPKLRAWSVRYAKKFSAAPTMQALQGYMNARLFLDTLRRLTHSPTQNNFAHKLERMGAWTDAELGGIPIVFMPGNHLGTRTGFLARIRNGRWVVLTGALE